MSATRWAIALLGAGTLIALFGCSAATSEPRQHQRRLSISTSPRQIPPPTIDDFVAAFDLVYGAGARGQLLTATWKELEPQAGALDVLPLVSQIDYAASRTPTIFVGIQVINTVAKEVPADLADTPFDDAATRLRFHALIDQLAAAVPGKVTYLSIGNEVDGYLQSTGGWDAYRRFYEDALDYAHSKLPGVQVGVTGGFDGVTGSRRTQMAALNTRSDVIMLTYYPLLSDGHVKEPTIARTAFPMMLAAAGDKPVILQELGYPASTRLGSSDAMQAAFFSDAIAEWSRVDGSRMPFVNIFLLHDFTADQCDTFSHYYGLPGNEDFKAFLCTLGLRLADGTPRPAWQAVVRAARDAGLPVQ